MPAGHLKLSHTFVAMLFAVAVAEIARRTALLVEINGSFGWDAAAAALHLLLALAVVTASWVGWSRATSRSKPIQDIFGLPYVVLLVDVFLVMVYLVIVLGSEIDTVNRKILTPSASPEAVWVTVMLGIYVLWDLIYDVKMQRNHPLVAMAASGSAFLAALGVCLWDHWRPFETVLTVVSADVALIGVVIAFRAMKGLEEKIVAWLCLKGQKLEGNRGHWQVGLAVSTIAFGLGIAGMAFGR